MLGKGLRKHIFAKSRPFLGDPAKEGVALTVITQDSFARQRPHLHNTTEGKRQTFQQGGRDQMAPAPSQIPMRGGGYAPAWTKASLFRAHSSAGPDVPHPHTPSLTGSGALFPVCPAESHEHPPQRTVAGTKKLLQGV